MLYKSGFQGYDRNGAWISESSVSIAGKRCLYSSLRSYFPALLFSVWMGLATPERFPPSEILDSEEAFERKAAGFPDTSHGAHAPIRTVDKAFAYSQMAQRGKISLPLHLDIGYSYPSPFRNTKSTFQRNSRLLPMSDSPAVQSKPHDQLLPSRRAAPSISSRCAGFV